MDKADTGNLAQSGTSIRVINNSKDNNNIFTDFIFFILIINHL